MAIRSHQWISGSLWSLLPQDDSFSAGDDLPLSSAIQRHEGGDSQEPTTKENDIDGHDISSSDPDKGGSWPAYTSTTPESRSAVSPTTIDQTAAKVEFALTSTESSLPATQLVDPSLTFRLHSDPTANKVIYLDFDGHTTTGTPWNSNFGVSSYVSPAYNIDGDPSSFSITELEQVQQIWQQAAADFAPFSIDVTTQLPPTDWLSRSDNSDINYGMRVVITSYGPEMGGAGVAFVDSFTWDTDTPAFVYAVGPTYASTTISHEVGHTLGLDHDGTSLSPYYTGHGTGEESWGPIMGSSPSKNVTTWDDGTYKDSNNGGTNANYGKGPDDLYIITSYNGIPYRADTEGSSILNTAQLGIADGAISQFGVITTRSDQDYFSFNLLSPGTLTLSADPYWCHAFVNTDGNWGGSNVEKFAPVIDVDPTTSWVDNGANLDLSIEVMDESGQLVAASNPYGLRASFNALALPAGKFFLKVDGVGAGDPTAATPTGYSDYASIGNYWLSGSISSTVQPPTPTLPTLSASDRRVLEGNSGGTTNYALSVSLNTIAAQDVTLTFSTRDGSATSKGKNADFTAISNGRVVISKGQLSAQILLSINADSRSEADEHFYLDFTSLSGATLGKSSVDITIVNDDIITGGGGGKKSPALALAIAPDYFTSQASKASTRDPLTDHANSLLPSTDERPQSGIAREEQISFFQQSFDNALPPIISEAPPDWISAAQLLDYRQPFSDQPASSYNQWLINQHTS